MRPTETTKGQRKKDRNDEETEEGEVEERDHVPQLEGKMDYLFEMLQMSSWSVPLESFVEEKCLYFDAMELGSNAENPALGCPRLTNP